MTSLLFFADRPALRSLLLGTLGLAALVATSARGQNNFQGPTGYTPQPIPGAYQQINNSVPASSQSRNRGYASNRAPTGYAPQQVPGGYYPQQTNSNWQQVPPQKVPTSLNNYPAYQQLPAQQAPKPQAQPASPAPAPAWGIPGQIDGPVPYPSANQVPGAQPPAPKPTDANVSQLANEVAQIRNNDRTQDRRLDQLERSHFSQPTSANPGPTQPSTRLTYVKHQVRARESIWGIADRYGVTAEDIRKANNRRSDFISEGEVLYIPQRVTTAQPLVAKNTANPSVASSGSNGTHTVQRGDTLSSIAAKYHVSPKALQSANGIRNPNVIALNQKLVIPGKGNGTPVNVKAATKDASKPRDSAQHFVAAGKNEPARKTPSVVKAPEASGSAAGTATGSVIKPVGQRGITSYRVEQGDKIDGVAKSFGTTAAELRRLNRISDLPKAGEEIVVPLPGSVAAM